MSAQASLSGVRTVQFTDEFAAVGTSVAMPAWKRTLDVVLAAGGLMMASPALLLIALAVALDSPGSPLFRQTRVGRGGATFSLWKFRSMRRDAQRLRGELTASNEANGHMFKLRHDPRVTRVGRVLRKTSADELPQRWNVLRGEMGLVGPRPEIADEVARYTPHELRRLALVPGITGLWQVTAREHYDFASMLVFDLEYAERMGFWFDMQILMKTIPAVIGGKGAC